MNRFYLVPVEIVSQGEGHESRGPKYFDWRFDPDPPALISSQWAWMTYGFTPYGLLLAIDISPTDHASLIANSDVYAFPENLDQPVTDPNIDTFFEGIHIPTDWLTPATTYRELIRQTAGMIQINQRYKGIAANETGEWRSIFDTMTLDDRLRDMTSQEEEWFYKVVESFGYSRDIISRNTKFRTLLKQAGDFFAEKPFYLGGVEF